MDLDDGVDDFSAVNGWSYCGLVSFALIDGLLLAGALTAAGPSEGLHTVMIALAAGTYGLAYFPPVFGFINLVAQPLRLLQVVFVVALNWMFPGQRDRAGE